MIMIMIMVKDTNHKMLNNSDVASLKTQVEQDSFIADCKLFHKMAPAHLADLFP